MKTARSPLKPTPAQRRIRQREALLADMAAKILAGRESRQPIPDSAMDYEVRRSIAAARSILERAEAGAGAGAGSDEQD